MLGTLPLTFVREWEEKYRSQQVTDNYTLNLDKHKIKALISPKNEKKQIIDKNEIFKNEMSANFLEHGLRHQATMVSAIEPK